MYFSQVLSYNSLLNKTTFFHPGLRVPSYKRLIRTCWTSTGTEHSITFKLKEKVKVDQVIVIGKADSSLLMNSVRVSDVDDDLRFGALSVELYCVAGIYLQLFLVTTLRSLERMAILELCVVFPTD